MAGGATPRVIEAKGWGAGLGSPEELIRTPELLAESRGSRGATEKCALSSLAAWTICPIFSRFSRSCLDNFSFVFSPEAWNRMALEPMPCSTA